MAAQSDATGARAAAPLDGPIRFDGQVAVVTGAGRGLGRAHALELARRGAAVVVNDLDADAADRVVAEAVAAGGRAVASGHSVADPDQAPAVAAIALDAFGRLDVLVHNAGIVSHGWFEDLTLDQIDRVLDTDLRSAFLVGQPAWRAMKARGYGRVVLTGSGSGMLGHQGTANYAAAKAGLFGLTRALAFEGAPHGIGVNMVLPMARTAIADGDPIPDFERHRSAAVPERASGVVAGRSGVDANAAVVAFLASRQCTLNGEAVDVCFGRCARLFVGLTQGWLPDDPTAVSPEALASHLDVVRRTDGYRIPSSLFDEMGAVAARLVP